MKKLYKKLPHIKCKGLCHDQCTIIKVEPIERKQIINKLNFDPFMNILEHDETFGKMNFISTKFTESRITCPMLDQNNRCSIYEIRPFICRLYGVTKRLICPHGCMPENFIKDTDAAKLWIELEKLEG